MLLGGLQKHPISLHMVEWQAATLSSRHSWAATCEPCSPGSCAALAHHLMLSGVLGSSSHDPKICLRVHRGTHSSTSLLSYRRQLHSLHGCTPNHAAPGMTCKSDLVQGSTHGLLPRLHTMSPFTHHTSDCEGLLAIGLLVPLQVNLTSGWHDLMPTSSGWNGSAGHPCTP